LNFSSQLIPSAIKAQSEDAISMLQADNERILAAVTALNAFIDDTANRANSFELARQKMRDYLKVANALILANDEDISDHEKLIHLVGDVTSDLIGDHILTELQQNILDRNTAEIRIAHYQSIIDTPRLSANSPLVIRVWLHLRALIAIEAYVILLLQQ